MISDEKEDEDSSESSSVGEHGFSKVVKYFPKESMSSDEEVNEDSSESGSIVEDDLRAPVLTDGAVVALRRQPGLWNWWGKDYFRIVLST